MEFTLSGTYVIGLGDLRHGPPNERRVTQAGRAGAEDAARVRFQPSDLPADPGAAAAPDVPTVVLVHGAFDDPSSWWLVVQALKARRIPVVVRSIPARGLVADADYLVERLGELDGPVMLVGHSYGGAVVSAAASRVPEVAGLVLIASSFLDAGESLSEHLTGARCRAPAQPTRPAIVREPPRPSPEPLPDDRGLTRPVLASTFSDRAPAAAWRDLPTWAMVVARDPALAAEAQRRMARRAGAVTVEVDAGHAVAVTHPLDVTLLVLRALRTVAAASRVVAV